MPLLRGGAAPISGVQPQSLHRDLLKHRAESPNANSGGFELTFNSILPIIYYEHRKPRTEESADSQVDTAHAFKGKPLDPEVAKRIHLRAEKVRENLREKGVTNFTADLVRECRYE